MRTNRMWTYLLILAVLGLLVWSGFSGTTERPKASTISEIATLVTKGEVRKLRVDGDSLIAERTDGTELKAFKEAGVSITDYGIDPNTLPVEVNDPNRGTLLSSFVSVILPFLLVGLFLWFLLRQAQGNNLRAMSFGQSRAKLVSKKKATFNDVAGLKSAKQELVEVVDFLKHPAKYRSIGAEIPKGVLLIGAPGVGKTLLAKAVAGEAGVPFYSLSASEFVEMFVGVGAARVRDLFMKAKRNAPAVIFIDELDAIGRQRGSGLGGSHDEREQTLNQILVEMDGFDTDTRVIVLAATNRPDVLDPALLRPGRFDRRVILELPDRDERAEILALYLANKPVASGTELGSIAAATAGASGADLKNIANEAAILTARANAKHLTQAHLESAIEKVLIGPERQSQLMNDDEKRITAYHEVGHALVGHYLLHTDPVHKISLVSRGSALGYTWSLPERDRRLVSRSKFIDEIAQALGGRVAEQLVFGEITTGAANDLKKATQIARDMVRVYGMSDALGPIQFSDRDDMIFLGRELHEARNYSDAVAGTIDVEVKAIIERATHAARDVLTKHRRQLDTVATALLKEEMLDRAAFEKLVGGLAKQPSSAKRAIRRAKTE